MNTNKNEILAKHTDADWYDQLPEEDKVQPVQVKNL